MHRNKNPLDCVAWIALNAGPPLVSSTSSNGGLGPGPQGSGPFSFRDGAYDPVNYLRRKLEADPTRPRLIVTEPGVGYRLKADG